MPSVATTGLGQDLILAGSKASIFTSVLPNHHRIRQKGVTGFEKNAIEYSNGLNIRQAGLQRREEVFGINANGIPPAATNTKENLLVGSTTAGLANLQHRFGRVRGNSGSSTSNTTRIGSSHGPPTLHYTNRQKHLLEQDGNQRHTLNQDLNTHLPTESHTGKENFNNKLGLSTLQKDTHSFNHTLLHRPRSSQVELSKNQTQCDDFDKVLVQRHASDTRLSQDKGSGSVSTSPTTLKIRSPETLKWTLQGPGSREKNNKSGSRDVLDHSFSLRPSAPEPVENPATGHSPGHRSPGHRSPGHQSPRPVPNDEVLIANREYIDAVAKENQDFKNELNKSLNRLLKRAVKSAGPVTEEEVQNLRAQFNKGNSGVCDSPACDFPVCDSPTGPTPTPRSQEEGKSYFDHLSRRASVNSGDSGISSETVDRERDTLNLEVSSTCHSPTRGRQKGKRSRGNQRSDMLAEDPFNVLRPKGKKSSKLKKRKSGKKSRQKSRQESASGKHRKRATKDALSTPHNGATESTTPNNNNNVNMLNFQAYCTPLQVLPASYKPKPERPHVQVPQFTVKAQTTAIYAKKLPRVPAPTLTCDPIIISSVKNQLDVTQSYPVHKRSISLQAAGGVTSQEHALRKSLNESLRFNGSQRNGQHEEQQKITKIYLSEKQSGVMNELGIDMPCAPPVTPMPDILKRIEYIPSMYDIRAQRAVKGKLEILERQEIKRKEKLMVQQLKNDKISQKEREKHRKKHQRLQVYALNKLMTEFEHKNFVIFCQANGIQCDL